MQVESTRARLARADTAERHAEALLSALRDAETAQRGFLLTGGRTRYLQPYEQALPAIRESLESLQRAAAAEPALRGAAETLARLTPPRLEEMARTIALQRAGRAEEALKHVATDEGNALMEGLRGATAALRGAANTVRAEANAAIRRMRLSGMAAAAWFAFAGLALGALGLRQRHRAARDLPVEGNRVARLAEALPGFVWTARPDGQVDWQSAPWHAFSGARPGRALGTRWLDFVHPEDRDATAAVWGRALATGRAYEVEMRLRAADGSWRWFLTRAHPERDRAGRIARWVGVSTDIDARHRAEEGLRATEERFRLALRAAQAAIYDQDLETGTVLRSADHARLFGAEDEAAGDWPARIHQEDAPAALAAMRDARDPGGAPGWDLAYRVQHPDGTWRHVRDRALVQRDAEGWPRRVVGSLLDITRVREQEAENARLAAIVAFSGDAIVSASAETRRILTWNRAAERLFGWTEAEAVGADVGLLVPPDLPEGEPGGVFHWAMEGHPVQDHETERMTRDGQRIPVAVTASRMVADGRVVGVASLFRDLRPRREAEARQQALLREVDHRAKNALAVVQSVVRLTRADTAQDFSRIVEGRIGALARAHTLLAQQEWRGAMLHDVLQQELGAWDGQRPDGSRVLLSGPPVRLCSTAVQPLAMVVHELTANAARHGALSVPEGRIEVAWGFSTDGQLRLHWMELAGPPVRKPPRRGFGNSVVEATMRTQLGGEARLEWEPQGLACTLILGSGRATRGGVQQGVAEPPRPATSADTTPLRGRRVLLAEDEPLMGIELRAMLEELGCTVLGPAATFEETQALAASERGVDAAVLDVNLEGRPSFPVADLLAARGVPVAFLTAHGDLPSRAAADGRTALMRKPVDRTTLAATLRHLLAASRTDSGRGVA